ncbi:MAG: hypothetical protein U0452_11350 [Anaerolineae bacterium]
MATRQKPLLLNRAIFVLRPFQATALTPLTTLIHRFPVAGTFEVFIRRDGSLLHRAPVQVADGGVFQINIDMAGTFDSTYAIAPGGALGFFVSKGEGAYSVSIDRITGRERANVLDSTKGVPAGDLFAVTLVRAGRYRVVDVANKIDGVITVEPPPPPPTRLERAARDAAAPRQRFRPDQPTGATISRGEMKPKEVRIFAGQTVVFDCTVASNLRVEPQDRPTVRSGEAARPGKLRRSFPKAAKTDKK